MEAEISDKPMDRLTRMAGAARKAITEHPEYDEDTDRFLMSVNDDHSGGFFASGYDGPPELIVDLLEHAKGTLESIGGGTMEFVPDAKEGMVIHLRFTPQVAGHRAKYEVGDGSIRAAIIVAFMPAASPS